MHALAAPAEKVAALAGRFTTAGFPHAFAGRVALSAHVRRTTVDRIDLHVFVAPREAEPVLVRLAVLGLEVDRTTTLERIAIRGGAELFWGATPFALTLGVDGLQELARPRVRRVPFAERWIYVLSAEDLLLASALSDAPAAETDLEELVAAVGPELDREYVLRGLAELGVADRASIPVLQRLLAPGP